MRDRLRSRLGISPRRYAQVTLVALAALSLIIVSTHGSKTVPRASITKPETVHPRSLAPEPMTPSTVKSEAVAPVQTPAATEKKSRRGKTAPKPAKKWDPDALFPQ